jgi:hypothetical protein
MNKFAAHALRPWGYSGRVWRVRSPLAGVRQRLLIPSAANAFYSLGLVVPIRRFSDLRPSTMSTDPAVPQPRVIVLCFDGTSNQYDATVGSPTILRILADAQIHQNTNVVKFYALLDKRCPLEQVVYYQVRFWATHLLPPRISIAHSIESRTRPLTCLAAWRRNLLQPWSSRAPHDVARADRGPGCCMVGRAQPFPES